MALLWRPCTGSFMRSLGPGFKQAERVRASPSVNYLLFSSPVHRASVWGMLARPHAEQEFVHMLFQDSNDFAFALDHFTGDGCAKPRSTWQFAKFKVVKGDGAEVHRFILLRHGDKPFTAQRLADGLLHALASTRFDLDSWMIKVLQTQAAVARSLGSRPGSFKCMSGSPIQSLKHIALHRVDSAGSSASSSSRCSMAGSVR